jgi:hypothetical protein
MMQTPKIKKMTAATIHPNTMPTTAPSDIWVWLFTTTQLAA